MRINTEKLLEEAKKDYERTWARSTNLLKLKGNYFTLANKRNSHPLFNTILEARNLLLDIGFTEVITPSIMAEKHVYLQYGPEAPVILDRVFYLAGLPRADIGISKDKVSEINQVIPGFNQVRELQNIFRKYKKGEIESDDLTETLVEVLQLTEEQATQILALFPQFKTLQPVPTTLTLRSHTTTSWFPLLETRRDDPLPLQLFSIGPKFRREQKLDATHLYESWTASIVIMAEEISLDDGQKIAERFFEGIGFKEVAFKTKKATSKYYAPRTEFEAFIKQRNGEFIEVGDGGLYNPISLARYKIPFPVFNFGVGLERIAMIKTGITDIRKLVYPHLYVTTQYTDRQLAEMVEIARTPQTKEGEKLVKAIVHTAIKHANQPSPCRFLAHKGNFLERSVEIHVYEPDSDKKLIGPAALNTVYAFDGSVLGVPQEGSLDNPMVKEARDNGTSTGIRYLDSIAALAVSSIEERIRSGRAGVVDIRVKIAKLPSDVNVKVSPTGISYVTSRNKRINVKGPVFVGIKAAIT